MGSDYVLENYKVIAEAAAKKETTGVVQGGTAVVIRARARGSTLRASRDAAEESYE